MSTKNNIKRRLQGKKRTETAVGGNYETIKINSL